MTEADLADMLSTWEQALATLREALDLEVSTIARDAAIKRFEYNFELDDRNQTTHTYQESTAESVYRNLPGYYEAFVSLHRALTQLLERQ